MKRCLVADNSPIVRKVAKHFLTEGRWHVEEADNADDAAAVFTRVAPDLVFVDWQLAGMDAVELIKKFRRMEDGARPRILYVVSDENRHEIWRALKAGADDFLAKPFDRASFTGKVKELLPQLAQWDLAS